jgi:hypothetical protein
MGLALQIALSLGSYLTAGKNKSPLCPKYPFGKKGVPPHAVFMCGGAGCTGKGQGVEIDGCGLYRQKKPPEFHSKKYLMKFVPPFF